MIIGAVATTALLAWLAAVGRPGSSALIAWFVLLGLAAGISPVLTAHNRALFPLTLMGRGLTLMNLGTMGGVFVTQALTGAVVGLFDAPGRVYPLDAYRAAFAVGTALGYTTMLYLLARDPRESGCMTCRSRATLRHKCRICPLATIAVRWHIVAVR